MCRVLWGRKGGQGGGEEVEAGRPPDSSAGQHCPLKPGTDNGKGRDVGEG